MKFRLLLLRLFLPVAALWTLSTCKKEKSNPCDATIAANLPAISIDSVYRDGDKIIITGNVLGVGQDDAGLTAHGVVWSQNLTPSLQNGQSEDLGDATVTGRFTVTLDSLPPGDYQFRTYATNCTGTQYSGAVKTLMVTVQGKPYVQVNDHYLIAATGNDGIINPGDDVQYGFTVQNVGTLKADAVTATLYTAATQYIGNLSPGSINIGALNAGGAISGAQTLSFKVAANTPPGQYCLNVDIDADGETNPDTICFEVVQKVVANFTVQNDGCDAPCTLTFDAGSSLGQILNYNWDFGNGATASGKIATYNFTKAGTYNVKLTVNGSGGNSEKTIPVTVKAFTTFTDIPIPNSSLGAFGTGRIACDFSSGEYNYYVPTVYCFGFDACDFVITRLDNNGYVQRSPSLINGGWISSVEQVADDGFLFATSGFLPFFGLEKTDIQGNSVFYKEVTPVGSFYNALFAGEKNDQTGYWGVVNNSAYPNVLYFYNLDQQGNQITHYDSIRLQDQFINISVSAASMVNLKSLNQYAIFIEGQSNNGDHYLIFQRRDKNFNLIINKFFKNTIWNVSANNVGDRLILFGDFYTNQNASEHNLRYFQVDLNGAIVTAISDRADINTSDINNTNTCLSSDGNVCIATTISVGNDTDVFIAKYSVDNHNFMWERTFTSPVFLERAEVINETPDGGFVISGSRGMNVLFIKTDPDGKID